jgi:hypothetical protein
MQDRSVQAKKAADPNACPFVRAGDGHIAGAESSRSRAADLACPGAPRRIAAGNPIALRE